MQGRGGAVAEVGVAAVDAHPRQLLLLAVAGRGAAAGQRGAQDHCKASTEWGVRGAPSPAPGPWLRNAVPDGPGSLCAALTTLRLNAEAVLEALVGVGAGDDLRVGAPLVHVLGANDDVAAIALEPGH